MSGDDTQRSRRGDAAALARAIGRYARAPLGDRLFIRGRALLADLSAIEPQVPASGTVVELGCGRGLFANLLAEASPHRDVLGIDPDPRRIAVARLTERPGLRFRIGDARGADLPAADAIVLVDVLYLLRPDEQASVLARAATALRPGGRIVVYVQERRSDVRFWLGYAQELVSIGAGLTRGRAGRLHYSSRREMLARLAADGLEVRVMPLPGRLYTDAIYVAERPP